MVFQLLNNIKFTLGAPMAPDDLELIVVDDDLADASRYDPNKVLSLTLIGDEELNDYEIVYAISRTGTTFEVTRGEETTTAGSWPAGTAVIAALTEGVLTGTISSPTSADQISYGGGHFGAAGDLETTLDDMGDAIITLASNTDAYEYVQQRVGGGLFSGGAVDSTNLRWQGSAKKFTTNGLGATLTTECTIAKPSVMPDLMLAVRVADVSNFGSIRVIAYDNAAPTNTMTWDILSTQIPTNGAWLLAFLPASAATLAGTPSVNLPDRVKIEFTDDGTGTLDISINHLDVVRTRESFLGSFVRVSTNLHFDKIAIIAKYGFQASLIINVEDLAALDVMRLTRAQLDGHRFFLTSPANFKAQTVDQVMVKLYTGQREAFNVGLTPDGWVYLNGYNGPLDLDPNTSIRRLVSLVYPRAVGVGSFRSAVEVYTYDDPLKVEASLATAQADLTGTNKMAINVDLSALSTADLETLYAGIVTSKNFYSTTLDYQNADNLKSGTVGVERLPVVPVAKGGTGLTSLAEVAYTFGCPIGVPLPFAGATAPIGWVLCDGRLLLRASYPLLFAVIGTQFGTTVADNFRVPDLRGFVVAGMDNMGTGAAGRLTNIASTLGTVGGAQNHTLTVAQMPSHAHGAQTGGENVDHAHYQQGTFNTGYESAGHQHGVNDGQGAHVSISGSGAYGAGGSTQVLSGGVTANHYHAVTIGGLTSGRTAGHVHGIGAEGGGATHNNTQLTMVLNWIIRAA